VYFISVFQILPRHISATKATVEQRNICDSFFSDRDGNTAISEHVTDKLNEKYL
jgi:hypothetical protein